MDLVSVRIITDNLDTMVEFYEKVTGVTADRPAPVFAELRYPSCTLALGHTSTAMLFNNAARPADNQTAIIEWMVDDVDAEYQRLKQIVSDWEQEPKLMPWGNRSILFRDPDGNLVNLFTPATEDAIKRFRREQHANAHAYQEVSDTGRETLPPRAEVRRPPVTSSC